MAHDQGRGTEVDRMACGRCGRPVGLIWFAGHSTLIEGPCDTFDDLVTLRLHSCRGTGPGPTNPPGGPPPNDGAHRRHRGNGRS